MYYLRARYYDPSIGRFTSYDIEKGNIVNPLDMNRYVYCVNNPIKYVDPSGEFVAETLIATSPEWIPWLIAGIAATIVTIEAYYSIIK